MLEYAIGVVVEAVIVSAATYFATKYGAQAGAAVKAAEGRLKALEEAVVAKAKAVEAKL